MKEKAHNDSPNQIVNSIKTYLFFATLLLGTLSLVSAQNPNANENATVYGGEITFVDGETYTSVCAGDGEADYVEVLLENASGRLKQWIITDEDGYIVGLPDSPSDINFDEAGVGICLIYHLSYNGMKPLVDPSGQGKFKLHIDEVTEKGNGKGRSHLSEPIMVERFQQPTGGTLEGGPFEFCVGDGVEDKIPDGAITLSGNMGTNSLWVVTDSAGKILGLPASPYDVNFDEAPEGVCLIWHLSYENNVSLDITNADELMGCFSLTNPLTVNRIQQPAGGDIALADGSTEIEICAGDGNSDLFEVTLTGASGGQGVQMLWVITDSDANILDTSDSNSFDLEGAGEGICLIWHLSYAENVSLDGITNANDLMGCFDLSNPITVIRNGVSAGEIQIVGGGTEIEICAGDGNSDAFDVEISGDLLGDNTAWVITNNADDPEILGLPAGPPFDLEGAGEGACLIWHIAFEDGLEGVAVGNNVSSLSGCYVLSNAITVIRNGVNAGEIEIVGGGTEIEICAGDGNSDAFDVEISGDLLADNAAWVITNNADDPEILGLPAGPPFDLEGAGEGTCLIWHIAFEDGLEGVAVGNNVSALSGCYALSNPITVIRNGVNAGEIQIVGGGTGIEICSGDGNSDAFDVEISGDLLGDNMAWVITNNADDPEILGLPAGPPFDLEGAGEGTCLIWHIAFQDGLEGVAVGNNVSALSGCYVLSNPITVTRNAVNGGTISGGTDNNFDFTVGDGTEDKIPADAITLEGHVGTNSTWVVTNEDGTIILGLPNNYFDFDFDGTGAGVCKIWHLSYEDGLTGTEVPGGGDHLVSGLEGCFRLSNAITVTKTTATTASIATALSSSSKVVLFPNPAKGSVNIQFSNFRSNEVNVSIFNLINAQLSNRDYSSSSKRTMLDISNYESGLYFILVTDKQTGESTIKRLVVN